MEAVGFCRTLPLAATAGTDGKLLVWDCHSLSVRQACQHPEGVSRLTWHPTQPLVFTGCLDGVARCWDLRTGAVVREWAGHRNSIQDMCVSPDGGLILCGSDDFMAKVFKL